MRKPLLGIAVWAIAAWVAVLATPAHAHQKHREVAAQSTAIEREAAAPPVAEHQEPAAASEAGDHAHSTPRSAAGETGGERAAVVAPPQATVLGWLGKFHPPLTHFPIALVIAAALAECLLIKTRREEFAHTVGFCVRLGGGAALLAALLGWFYAGFRLVDDEWLMTAHRWAGTSTAVLAAVLLTLHERASREASRVPFRVALFASTALVGATGFLGGALLYGIDHYAWGAS